MEIQELIAEIKEKRPDLDCAEVQRAYEFARDAHEGQTRYSGAPYITHPVAATSILLRLNPDLASVQACLMHDVTEDTERTRADIEAEFGAEVADLVEGMEKLAVVKVKAEGESEKWKKMFLSMAKDVRIVFIKLSDRLHNLRTLAYVPEHKRERIAKESLMVHAAIASRLGIYQIKGEMEDLCFKYLHPEEYEALSEQINEFKSKQEELMSHASDVVQALLDDRGIEYVEVQSRLKHLWSIREKMKHKDVDDISEIFDLFAVRVILPSLEDEEEDRASVYSVLGILHSEFVPLQSRFKDYVAIPKPNGYRSLHTTVMGLGADMYDAPTEIQIRTEAMHREAELGVASHWEYKNKRSKNPKDLKRHQDMLEALERIQALLARELHMESVVREWVEHYQHMAPVDRKEVERSLRDHGISNEDLEAVKKGRSQENPRLGMNVDKQLAWLRGLGEEEGGATEMDLFPNKIFVLTPRRDVVELPKGATPVDFAYHVHTEVGNKMVHAKVNGRVVPLDYKLRNGEMVSVGTRRDAKPSEYWLSIAATSSAKAKIRNYFNRRDKDVNIAKGRELLNKELSVLGKESLDDKLSLLKEYGGLKRDMSEREQILEALALGSNTVSKVVKTLFPGIRTQEKELKEHTDNSHEQLLQEVLVTGQSDLPVVLSACCKPRPPQPIIAYVGLGNHMRVHALGCKELGGLEPERFVSAHWKSK